MTSTLQTSTTTNTLDTMPEMQNVLAQTNLQLKIFENLKLGKNSEEVDLEDVKKLNDKSEMFKEAEGNLKKLIMEKTQLKSMIGTTEKSLTVLDELITAANKTLDGSKKLRNLTDLYDATVFTETELDLSKEIVVVAIGARTWLEFSFEEARDFYNKQLEKGKKQLELVQSRITRYGQVVTNFNDETMKLKYGIKDNPHFNKSTTKNHGENSKMDHYILFQRSRHKKGLVSYIYDSSSFAL